VGKDRRLLRYQLPTDRMDRCAEEKEEASKTANRMAKLGFPTHKCPLHGWGAGLCCRRSVAALPWSALPSWLRRGRWLVLEGDWGGQIYLTMPLRAGSISVHADVPALLERLDKASWEFNGGLGATAAEHPGKVGDGVLGGMGGGALADGLWLHPKLEHLREEVLKALTAPDRPAPME